MTAACASSGGPQEWTPPPHEPVHPVRFSAEQVALDEAVFPLAVMAGEPGPGRMLLWTRAGQSDDLRLKVWLEGIDPQDPELVDMLVDEPVTPDEWGFVRQQVQVVPGRWHRFAFFTQPVSDLPRGRSLVGGFTAAPPDGALVRLTASGTHGTHQSEEPYPVLARNAEFEPYTLYFHLGDSIYSDSKREPITPAACSLDEYLAYWDANWRTAGFRAALQNAVYLPVPDDHEVANNYDAEFVDPDCPDRLANGKRAFLLANPWSEPAVDGRLWRSWRWGDTLEVFALDARSERMPSTRDDPGAEPPVINPGSVFLGREQFDWLTQGLADSSAVFKLVLNSVPLIDFPNPPWLNMFGCDTWMCYSTQRRALIDFIRQHAIDNVFFLSGDFHMATVAHLDPPGGAGHGLFEFFLGPGAQSNPLGDRHYVISQLGEDYDPLPPEQFLWGHPTPTMTYLDLDPLADPPALTVRYYEPGDDRELFRATFAGGRLVEQP
jgi:alkaline phosphatase D